MVMISTLYSGRPMLARPVEFPSVEPAHFTDRPWYALLVLGVALIFTAAGTFVLHQAVTSTDDDRLAITVANAEQRIQLRMETYAALLRGAAGFFDGSEDITRENFAAYAQHIDLPQHHPGIVGIGWITPVPAGSEAKTTAWLTTQGFAPAQLWSAATTGETTPGHERTAILLIEPDSPTNRRVLGFDMMSEQVRRLAMTAARDIGMMQISNPVTLVQDTGISDEPGFLAFVPIFAHGDRQRFRGWVYAPFRCADLFASLFDQGPTAPLTYRIRDAAGGLPLYDTIASDRNAHTVSHQIAVFGHQWLIDFNATTIFERHSNRWLVPLFTSASLVLGFALFLLARAQVRAVGTNAELYRLSSTARREVELSIDVIRRLASTIEPKAVAQAVTDAGRELTDATFGVFLSAAVLDGELGVYAHSGETTINFTSQGLPRIKGLLSATVAQQSSIRLDDVRIDPRFGQYYPHLGIPDGLPAMASYLAVVVKSRSGNVLGGLVYAHAEPGRFTADQERRLLDLANQAAFALENARRYEAQGEARRIAGDRVDDLNLANSELQQFIYVSSHDLQEPLRTITQYLDLLKRRHASQLDDQARRYIAYASESASHMYVLLNDLLTYSRLGHAAERTEVNLSEVLAEVVQDLNARISETLAQIICKDLPVVRCDRSKLRSLLQNLIGNALKFRGRESPRVMVYAVHDANGTWTIGVSDNGIGIRPEHRLAVFEVFHRLHNRDEFPGTGIGLAICRKVVEQHGGQIWIEETPGGGATFRFTLPEDGSGIAKAKGDAA